MVEKETLDGSPEGGGERRTRRVKVSLTQYLESQEDQDMIKLLYFTRT